MHRAFIPLRYQCHGGEESQWRFYNAHEAKQTRGRLASLILPYDEAVLTPVCEPLLADSIAKTAAEGKHFSDASSPCPSESSPRLARHGRPAPRTPLEHAT